MSRDLKYLHPYVRSMALKLVERCKEYGILVSIATTIRTLKEQKELYAIGRTQSGKIETNRDAGNSYHQYGLAFDIVCINLDSDNILEEYRMYEIAGKVGKYIGLGWGGDQKEDGLNHFYWTGGLTIIDLKLGDLPVLPELPDLEEKKEKRMKREYKKRKTLCDIMVREKNDISSSIIGIIQKGNFIRVFSEDYMWAEIEFIGKTAYVRKNNLI